METSQISITITMATGAVPAQLTVTNETARILRDLADQLEDDGGTVVTGLEFKST